MILFVQATLNLILGYWLSNKLFVPYRRIAFLFYPLLTIVFIAGRLILTFALNNVTDPSAIAMGGNVLIGAFIMILLSIAMQAVFHFFVFNAIRKDRTT